MHISTKVVIFHHNESLKPLFFELHYNTVKLDLDLSIHNKQLDCIPVPFRTSTVSYSPTLDTLCR
jgi:hypothetical protein